MTKEWSAGHKADATRVAALLRDGFESREKKAIRAWVTAEIAAAKPTRVLDLWGGGQSAEEMVAAGLTVLSVDDGRIAKSIARDDEAAATKFKRRIHRALQVKADMGGYESGWGKVAKYAADCDAAWLDFMGHLSGEAIRTLAACRHMRCVFVTLMPERMAGAERLPVEIWLSMYRAAVEEASGLRARYVRKYRRPGGQWVLVLALLPLRSLMEHGAAASQSALRANAYHRALYIQPDQRAKKAAKHRWRMENEPGYAERLRENRRARRRTPEQRAARNAYERARYADPEVRSATRNYQNQYRTARLVDDPSFRERERQRSRNVRGNPVRRAKNAAKQRELRAKWKADGTYEERRRLENARRRARLAGDPKLRELTNARQRERYAARRAAG